MIKYDNSASCHISKMIELKALSLSILRYNDAKQNLM